RFTAGSSAALRDRTCPVSDRPRHPLNHHWLKLDVLALHRRKREAIRALVEGVEKLQHLVGMLDQLAHEVLPGDEADHLRGAATMMRAAANGIMEAATDIAGRLGEIRFMATLDHITVDETEEQEPAHDGPQNDDSEPEGSQ